MTRKPSPRDEAAVDGPHPGDPNYVGRGHPPAGHRFKKGKSGNPGGRPKGRHRLATRVAKLLRAPIAYKDRTISIEDLIANCVKKNLVDGDLKAIPICLDLLDRADRSGSDLVVREIAQARQRLVQDALRRMAPDEPPAADEASADHNHPGDEEAGR